MTYTGEIIIIGIKHFLGFSEYNERLNEKARLYVGGSLNLPYSSFELYDGYVA